MGAPQYEQAGADIGGTGTTNTIPRWTGPSTLGDSLLTQSGTTVIGSSMTGFGIGTTVSPWGAGRYALQVGGSPTSNIVGGSPNTVFGSNQYHDGTDARYINNGFAATYVQSAGEHRWSTAASGTAGAVATLTQYMVINSSGNVGIGTASPAAKVHSVIADGVTYSYGASGTTKGLRVEHSAAETRIVGVDNTLNASYQPLVLGGSTLGFNTGGTTRALTIDSSGRILQGVTATPSFTDTVLVNARAGYARSYLYNSTASRGIYQVAGDVSGPYWELGGVTGAIGAETLTSYLVISSNAKNLQFAQPDWGLKLPATPGNADTQTLDCYQEGTWAPTLTGFGGTNPTVTARYTRVGRMVSLQVYITATGGATFSSTAATTYISLPAGMSPAVSSPGATSNSGIAADGPCVAYTNGNLYLPTFALRSTDTFLNVTYTV